MTAGSRRFVFGPLETRGVLLGLVPGQLLSLAGGLVLALVVVHASPDAFGVLAALVAITGGAGGACLPVSGRPPVSWLPVAVAWARRRLRGAAVLAAPLAGHPWGCGVSVSGGVDGVEILEVPALAGQRPIGVLRDRPAGAWAAVLPVRSGAFALLDPADKERRLAAWGAVLAGLVRAGSPVRRVQWVERAVAGDAEALGRHLAESAPGAAAAVPGADTGARRAYAELIAGAGAATLDHECLLVLAVDRRRGARSLGRGEEGVVAALHREIRLLQGQLRNADLLAGEPLDGAGLAGVLRAAFEPRVRRRRLRMSPAAAWPLATEEAWSSVRVEAAWYATFWIAEWPRVEVGPDFLAPLLLGGAERTVSVTMAPVAAQRARRQAEAARTAEVADEELRRRAGFLSTARRRREAEGVAQREAELADGHAELRFSGYVTVSGADQAALESACAEIEAQAQAARLDLRRLFGQQRQAFTWTLPLARGLA